MIDTAVLWMRAEAAIRAGRRGDALVHLWQLVEAVDRIDFEYEEWLRAMAECFRAEARWREAAACFAYLGATEAGTPEALQEEVRRAKAGNVSAMRGIRLYATYLGRAGHHRAAAIWFEAAGMPVHRAIELERAGDDGEAATMWAQLSRDERLEGRLYELALVKINHGLCLQRLGDERARGALAEATTAVEEVADAFETEGLRERAFDCYQILARLGSEAGAFENVAEGYLNSVRILRDDGLKLDALRLYEAFVAMARRAGEWHAVANILREAGDYCLRVGLPYAGDLRMRSGDAWLRAASEAQSAGHPLPIIENAYLAAAEGFASVRAFRQVADAYRKLAQLELPQQGQQRYARLADRLGDSLPDPPRPVPVPDFLKQLPEYEEVWYVDLAEWEIDGDPALTAAGVMADRRFPDFVRRHALLLVLHLERNLRPHDVVARLEAIKAYPVIAALEKLFLSPDPTVREAVAKAMGKLRFKRSFGLVGRALRDDQPAVRASAANSVGSLVFPHAFEPLRRIFESRDLPDQAEARAAAVLAIGKINSVEALDFLCDRLHEGNDIYADRARKAVAELANPELLPYVRQQIELVPAGDRGVLEEAAAKLAKRAR